MRMEGDRIQSDPFTFVIFTTPVSLPVDHTLCTLFALGLVCEDKNSVPEGIQHG